jgi:hypothetical protein
MLARHCAETVVETQNKTFAEQIGFVFECNDYSQTLLKGYGIAKTLHPRSQLFGPIAFDCKANNPMLQAADMIAWHYRRFTELRKGFAQGPIHRAAASLMRPDGVVFRYLPEKELRRRVGELFDRHGAEWNQIFLDKERERLKQRALRQARGKKWRGDTS